MDSEEIQNLKKIKKLLLKHGAKCFLDLDQFNLDAAFSQIESAIDKKFCKHKLRDDLVINLKKRIKAFVGSIAFNTLTDTMYFS